MTAVPEQAVVQTENLTRYFGDFLAVDHVTFDIQQGEVVGYLGPNGSGKTTTIRMLLGLLLPTEGSGHVLGFDIRRQSEEIRSRVGYMSQKFALYRELTVWENLMFYAGVYGVKERSHLDRVLKLVGLQGKERQRVDQISTGWRQRLALATAIVHQPKLLFLDEPTSGVDPRARRIFWDLIYQLVDTGVTVFVTTHYMDEAEYCGRVGIMRDGQLLAINTPSKLKSEALPGLAWDVSLVPEMGTETAAVMTDLQTTLDALQQCNCVLRAGLIGDHLRAITPADITASVILRNLQDAGIAKAEVVQAEPTLEDVFLALAVSS